MKLVSVVIPTYKRNDTLPRAINSVLNQTYKDIEVLVVDDNEPGDVYSQNNLNLLLEYKDNGRVKHVQQEHHTNGAVARNLGIQKTSGEYIAFLDDDDEWLPTKLEKQVSILDSHPEIGGVSCLYHELINDEIVHSCPPYSGENIHKKIFQREVAVFTSTILLRKDNLLKAGMFNPQLKRHQDLQLLIDFTLKNKFEVLNEYLVKLHIDSDINRPSYERLLNIKKDFFDATSHHLDVYSIKEQKLIKSAHEFELAFAALKEKEIMNVIRHFAKVGLSYPAYKMLWKRMQNRKYLVKD